MNRWPQIISRSKCRFWSYSEGISFRKSVGEPENSLTVVCADTEIWTRYFPRKVRSVTDSCRQRRRPVIYDFYQSVQRWCTWGRHLWRHSSLLLILQFRIKARNVITRIWMIFVYKNVRTRILASGVTFMTPGPNNWNKRKNNFNGKLSVNFLYYYCPYLLVYLATNCESNKSYNVTWFWPSSAGSVCDAPI